MKKLMLVVLVTAFAGCATEPTLTPQQIANADYGAVPGNHEKLIRDNLYQTMVDPNSMMLDQIGKPFKAYNTLLRRFGYGVYFKLNGKNKLGGYTGWAPHVAFIYNNQVVEIYDGLETNGMYYGSITFVRPVNQLEKPPSS